MASLHLHLHLHLLVLLSTCICLSVATSYFEFNYPAVFNFGDSNSDTGETYVALAWPVNSPYGQTFFHEPTGRFSDGRLIIDFLMQAMDKPFLDPYLDTLRPPSFRKGCNFAAASATILEVNSNSTDNVPFTFGIQVAQFLRFKSRVLQLLHQSSLPDDYLPSADYFTGGLYTFDMGQNDLGHRLVFETFDQVLDTIPKILEEFEAGIKKLYGAGARNFWIHNTGPLGCLPQSIAQYGTSPSKLDELGCVATFNDAAVLFNLQLHELCKKLKAEYTDANMTLVDVFSIKFNLIANYRRYGFLAAKTACCGYGGPPSNFDSRFFCGIKVVVDGQTITAGACGDSSEYVNWDGIHYTEAANYHVASRILSGAHFIDLTMDESSI